MPLLDRENKRRERGRPRSIAKNYLTTPAKVHTRQHSLSSATGRGDGELTFRTLHAWRRLTGRIGALPTSGACWVVTVHSFDIKALDQLVQHCRNLPQSNAPFHAWALQVVSE